MSKRKFNEAPDWMFQLPPWAYVSPLIFETIPDDINDKINDENILEYAQYVYDFILQTNNETIIFHFYELRNFRKDNLKIFESVIHVLNFLGYEKLPYETLYMFHHLPDEKLDGIELEQDYSIIVVIKEFRSIFNDYDYNSRSDEKAIYLGKLNYIQYLEKECNFKFDLETTEACFINVNLEIFKYLVSKGCPYEIDLNRMTIKEEINLREIKNFLQYLRELNYNPSKIEIIKLIKSHNMIFDMIKCIKEVFNFQFNSTDFTEYALTEGHTESFVYLISDIIQCPYELNYDNVIQFFEYIANQSYNFERQEEFYNFVVYLKDTLNFDFDDSSFTDYAAISYNVPLLKYLISINCPIESSNELIGNILENYKSKQNIFDGEMKRAIEMIHYICKNVDLE